MCLLTQNEMRLTISLFSANMEYKFAHSVE